MDLVGHFKCEKNENLNKFLKAAGLSFITRLFVRWSKPTMAVLKLEDLWSITVRSTFSSREKSFRIGQETTEFLPGKVIRSVSSMEDGKLVTKNVIDDKINTTTYYEFGPNSLTIRIVEEKTGIEARRIFKKLPTKL